MNEDIGKLIRPMSERRFEAIPVGSIVIVNPRNRDEKMFEAAVRNIDAIGLIKPITVNARNIKKTRKFELVCGQGRLEAHIKLGKKTIVAEIIDVDQKTAYRRGLIENLARSRSTTLEHIKILKEMRALGVSLSVLADITGYAKYTLSEYLRIIDHGELQVLQAVEDGIIPLTYARMIVGSDPSDQDLLLKGFDARLISTHNLPYIRRMLELRKKEKPAKKMKTVKDLEEEIRRRTSESEAFNFEAKQKEYRLCRLADALKTIKGDENVIKMMDSSGIAPALQLGTRYTGSDHI